MSAISRKPGEEIKNNFTTIQIRVQMQICIWPHDTEQQMGGGLGGK